ncbi:MAG: GtrA family protein [Endozoicomonas sp. (ex Botrylloides leachii)]|nr:GtrA family protein [Endozoicomonas sp. (ex Botrylloides leachii)]
MNRLIKFILVGSLAACVHLAILHTLVSYFSLTPLSGNIIAFAIAFFISYTGQSLWTFGHKQHKHTITLLRFLATQLFCSFALNQGLYALLLHFTGLNYMMASFVVLITVPLVTYTLSKYWAFK